MPSTGPHEVFHKEPRILLARGVFHHPDVYLLGQCSDLSTVSEKSPVIQPLCGESGLLLSNFACRDFQRQQHF